MGTLSCSEGKGHTFKSCRVRQSNCDRSSGPHPRAPTPGGYWTGYPPRGRPMFDEMTQDCRAQEAQCRRRAASDEQNRDLWLAMAERWSYLAKEAPFCFRESTPLQRVADSHGAG